MENNNSEDLRLHFTMVNGTVMYSDNRKADGNIHGIPVNAMFRSDIREYNRAALATMSRKCGEGFLQSLPEEEAINLKIEGVVINNMMYLGLMTMEEFQRDPLGIVDTDN